MSLPEFAASCGISERHLRQQIAEGKGPKVRKLGTRSIVTKTDGDAWLSELPLKKRRDEDKPSPPHT
jgi:predicted DNA-binding transcriptional regulator AlpA